MSKLILLIVMVFCHIRDDFGRQGLLRELKQREWWKNQKEYSDKYKDDWKLAMAAHAFSWTTSVFSPGVIYSYFAGKDKINFILVILFIFTTIAHAIIDNLKCNAREINLIEDQTMHLLQIIIVWIYFVD